MAVITYDYKKQQPIGQQPIGILSKFLVILDNIILSYIILHQNILVVLPIQRNKLARLVFNQIQIAVGSLCSIKLTRKNFATHTLRVMYI